jgi:hypothetical protein
VGVAAITQTETKTQDKPATRLVTRIESQYYGL